jgi:hypothetical protein
MRVRRTAPDQPSTRSAQDSQAMARHDDMPKHDDPTEIEPRPRPAADDGRGSTMAQLRQDIDSGATASKVAVLDPSMSPLGTDDEAAGAPSSPELVQAVREAERAAQPPPGDPGKAMGQGRGGKIALALLGLVALGVAAVFLA